MHYMLNVACNLCRLELKSYRTVEGTPDVDLGVVGKTTVAGMDVEVIDPGDVRFFVCVGTKEKGIVFCCLFGLGKGGGWGGGRGATFGEPLALYPVDDNGGAVFAGVFCCFLQTRQAFFNLGVHTGVA